MEIYHKARPEGYIPIGSNKWSGSWVTVYLSKDTKEKYYIYGSHVDSTNISRVINTGALSFIKWVDENFPGKDEYELNLMLSVD